MADGGREERQVLDFLGELYEAVGDPAHWHSVAFGLAYLFDSETCLLLIANTRAGGGRVLGMTDNIHGRAPQEHQTRHYAQDQWIAGGLRQADRAIIGHEIPPDDWYRNSELLNELCVRAGVSDLVGAALAVGGQLSAVVSIHRPKDRPPFGEADRRRLDLLMPHLRRAMRMTLLLSDARTDYHAALAGLERTGTAVILVDQTGRIVFTNTLADLLLKRGGSLRSVNGRLSGVDRNVAARLAFLIKDVTGVCAASPKRSPGGGLAIERDDGRPPITVLVTPFHSRPGESTAALILIRDPETPTMATDILQDLFGFTPAQATVAARVTEGDSLEDIAARLGISLYTVRDHLKVIFAKTATSRQSQLVALLAPTVAALRHSGLDDGAEKTDRRLA